jgi:hypothetical protein
MLTRRLTAIRVGEELTHITTVVKTDGREPSKKVAVVIPISGKKYFHVLSQPSLRA